MSIFKIKGNSQKRRDEIDALFDRSEALIELSKKVVLKLKDTAIQAKERAQFIKKNTLK